MLKTYLRLVNVAVYLSILLALVLIFIRTKDDYDFVKWPFYIKSVGSVFLAALVATPFLYLLNKHFDRINDICQRQAAYFDKLSGVKADFAIFASASVSLFLELVVIRWQAETFPLFAFYKNYSLLACFVGLGLGYALANRNSILALYSIPVLVFQVILLTFARFGTPHIGLKTTPFVEQLNMGVSIGVSLPQIVFSYYFLTVVFLLTVLCFIPIGQICGRVMTRRANLHAYGLNLLGSIFGVILMMVISQYWTPPVIWFCIGFAVLVILQAFDKKVILVGALASMLGFITLSWPVSSGFERLHSPYQLLERGVGVDGLSNIKAAGHYFQRILNLSRERLPLNSNYPQGAAAYYEFPYMVYKGSLDRVAVVGSGTGNDVAAALRQGANIVDAIEIDPAILKLGEMYHPETPYSDNKVNPVVNDARTFLRTTPNLYNVIVYGLLDSHTLLSQASSVRLDSFVYTLEGLKEARARLKEGGMISLSFSMMSRELGRKLYLMLKQAFDGNAPICIQAGYDGSVIFLQARDGGISIDAELLRLLGFDDVTHVYTNPDLKADVSTDDWPFFYMPKRVYPYSYFGILGLLVILSWLTTRSFIREKPRFGNVSFFFLGAGFMLVETKAITELGLAFGNTWQVIGIAISGILLMAFLANCIVQWFNIRRPFIWFFLLAVSLVAGFMISGIGGFDATITGRVQTVILLTSPMFFSGIIFSTLLAGAPNVAAVMASNILGAMVGGILEYNSMYFGFRFLYILALIIYVLALFFSLRIVSKQELNAIS